MADKKYSAESLETAACLWEAVLELERIGQDVAGDAEQEARGAAIRATRERLGSAILRQAVVNWTDAVEGTWALVDTIAGHSGSYDKAYDWDFVPSWIVERVDWSAPYPTFRPGVR